MPEPSKTKTRRWIEGEWGKRTAVLIATVLWAIFLREMRETFPQLEMSKWAVTGCAIAIYYIAFMLADLGWPKR